MPTDRPTYFFLRQTTLVSKKKNSRGDPFLPIFHRPTRFLFSRWNQALRESTLNLISFLNLFLKLFLKLFLVDLFPNVCFSTYSLVAPVAALRSLLYKIY